MTDNATPISAAVFATWHPTGKREGGYAGVQTSAGMLYLRAKIYNADCGIALDKANDDVAFGEVLMNTIEKPE